jgi:hypothetical protein
VSYLEVNGVGRKYGRGFCLSLNFISSWRPRERADAIIRSLMFDFLRLLGLRQGKWQEKQERIDTRYGIPGAQIHYLHFYGSRDLTRWISASRKYVEGERLCYFSIWASEEYLVDQGVLDSESYDCRVLRFAVRASCVYGFLLCNVVVEDSFHTCDLRKMIAGYWIVIGPSLLQRVTIPSWSKGRKMGQCLVYSREDWTWRDADLYNPILKQLGSTPDQ